MKDFLMQFLLNIIEKIPSWLKPKLREGKGKGSLEERLREKVKKDGWGDK